MSMSIVQGGSGPMCLAPWVNSYLCNGLDGTVIAIADVPSPDVQGILNQVCCSNIMCIG